MVVYMLGLLIATPDRPLPFLDRFCPQFGLVVCLAVIFVLR